LKMIRNRVRPSDSRPGTRQVANISLAFGLENQNSRDCEIRRVKARAGGYFWHAHAIRASTKVSNKTSNRTYNAKIDRHQCHRQPTDQELQGARYQGKRVAETAAKLAG
jgi:hypothetical protein